MNIEEKHKYEDDSRQLAHTIERVAATNRIRTLTGG